MHEPTKPTADETGRETHPAFGMISVHRVSSTPGQVLFDSDVRHQRTVRVSVSPATRQRDLNRDWIHDRNRPLIEVEMSEAQWASFVSSMNSRGVPCTLRATESTHDVPGLVYDPRLAHSMAEVRGAADKVFGRIQAAMDAYEQAVAEKAGAKVLREKLDALRGAIAGVEPNLTFAAESLNEYTEDVVQKARADIEAMVLQHAETLQLNAAETAKVLELPAITIDAEEVRP